MRMLQVNGIYLHVAEYGDSGAPVLVLVNSLGTDLRVWQAVLPALAREYRVITYDKRGHGLSSATPAPYRIADHAADLAALLDTLAIASAAVCGLSVGGMIALQLAASRPQLVNALLLCDTGHRIGTAALWNERIDAVEQGGAAALADAVMERWFSAAFRRREAAAVSGWSAMLARTSSAGYAGTCAAIRDADLSVAAQQLRVPTLCLCGAEDSVTTPAAMRELQALINGAELVLIAAAGHLPPVEQPAAFSAAALAFLRAQTPAASSYTTGMAVRRAVLGDRHVDAASAAATDFDRDFQRYITETAWGRVWARPGLSRSERSVLTVALLAALGHHEELAMHLRASRNTGADPADIREALLQVAVYAGVPLANSAFRIARDIFQEFAAMEDNV